MSDIPEDCDDEYNRGFEAGFASAEGQVDAFDDNVAKLEYELIAGRDDPGRVRSALLAFLSGCAGNTDWERLLP